MILLVTKKANQIGQYEFVIQENMEVLDQSMTLQELSDKIHEAQKDRWDITHEIRYAKDLD